METTNLLALTYSPGLSNSKLNLATFESLFEIYGVNVDSNLRKYNFYEAT